jgi:hypothetical protein
MYLLIGLLIILWLSKRNAGTTTSAAAATGGFHAPYQTLELDGEDLTGNTFDNGTYRPYLRSQSSIYDTAPGNMIYAVSGGEDGLSPALAGGLLGSTEVTSLGRFRMIGGGDPRRIPVVPVNVTSLNDKVRR